MERTGTEELERLRLSQSLDHSETRAAALYKEVCCYITRYHSD